MIAGSSAISNIQAAQVTEPHIRATLKYNSFLGKGIQGEINSIISPSTKTIVFNNRIIVFGNNIVTTTNNAISTYDKGGSRLNDEGISVGFINGVSWNDSTVLNRSDFRIIGNTLNFYYLKAGYTSANNYINKVYRVSTSNGISWAGSTNISTTLSTNIYDYDLAIGASDEIYTMAFDTEHSVLRYGTIGSSQKTFHTDMDVSSSYRALELFELGNKKYIIIESGGWIPYEASTGTTYYPDTKVKVLQLGLTSVFSEKKIGSINSRNDSLRLIYGGVNSESTYGYFALERRNYDINSVEGVSTIIEEFTEIDRTDTLCKMDSNGNIYERNFYIPQLLSVCAGGISNIGDVTITDELGEFDMSFIPFFESYGASTDISGNITSYTNTDNRRVSLELGNVK